MIHVGSSQVEMVNEFIYLEACSTCNSSSESEILQCIGIARNCMMLLRSTSERQYSLYCIWIEGRIRDILYHTYLHLGLLTYQNSFGYSNIILVNCVGKVSRLDIVKKFSKTQLKFEFMFRKKIEILIDIWLVYIVSKQSVPNIGSRF